MPFFSTPVPSPNRRNHFTPENSNLDLRADRLEKTDGDGTLPRSNVGASGNIHSEIRTPDDAFFENDMQFDDTCHSDIPELVPSAGVCLLCILYLVCIYSQMCHSSTKNLLIIVN